MTINIDEENILEFELYVTYLYFVDKNKLKVWKLRELKQEHVGEYGN